MKYIFTWIFLLCTVMVVAQSDYDERIGMNLFNKNSYSEALPYLQRAAKSGSLEALVALGQMYEKGWGVAKSEKIMMNMYNMGIQKNYAPALVCLGLYYFNSKANPEEACRLWTKAVSLRSGHACALLASCYYSGRGVASPDIEKAFEYYEKAISFGYNDAYNYMGVVHFQRKEWNDAYRALAQASGKDCLNNDGKMCLAILYYQGNGVEKDLQKSLKLLRQLKEDGYAAANEIYAEVDAAANVVVEPQFPGGYSAMQAFIKKNLKASLGDRFGVHGRVNVSFYVDKDGDIDYIESTHLHPNLDTEARRVVKIMPRWIPGTKGGSPATLKAGVSISF